MKKMFVVMVALIIVLSLCQFSFAGITGFRDTPSTVSGLQNALDSHSDVFYLGDSTL